MAQYKYIKTPDFEKVSKDFLSELQKASEGEKSPLSFLKTYLPQQPIITAGTIQTVVIGGTNYDCAVAEIHDGKPEITFREKGKLFPIRSAEDFNIFLDTHLTHQVSGIAVNIGFPLKYFQGEKGQPDGTFIKATKEHGLHGLLGHKVGEIVLDRYIRKHGSYTTVAVANDIICMTQDTVGIIVGTGFNLGIRGEDEKGRYVANLEAGNSLAYEPTEELESIDNNSLNQGNNRLEKLISGYYLPLHFNLLAKKHGIDKTISKAEELAEIAAVDQDKAGEIARELFARSAEYCAALIAGLYLFQGKPEQMTVSAEGSLFHYGYRYQRSLYQMLRELGIKDHTITFHAAQDSSLLGALHLLTK